MNDIEYKIFEYYVEEKDIASFSYTMMGKLLETSNIKKRVKLWNIREMYIYGGGYLGIQLYNAVKDIVNVMAVVDKSGGISVEVNNVYSISFDDFIKVYKNEIVIITPVKYCKEIKKDLSEYVKNEKILFLGEFLEGVI